jgi:hypothetical protein
MRPGAMLVEIQKHPRYEVKAAPTVDRCRKQAKKVRPVIRNNQSLAHDNVLLEKAEARFIFDSISAVLRFVKSIDVARFES